MSIYPTQVRDRSAAPAHAGRCTGENASGRDANFACGSFVAFSLTIDDHTKLIADAAFRSNGCGYMISAADLLCERVRGKHLSDLHGLEERELSSTVEDELGPFPENRVQCVMCCIGALHLSFADHRARMIEEYKGETALICTCFGVSEDTIERHIQNSSAATIADISHLTNAGTGCGSCRMLIQELLDNSTKLK